MTRRPIRTRATRFAPTFAVLTSLVVVELHGAPAHSERSIGKEVVVAASIAEVWRAWTSAEGLEFVSRRSNVELRIGGPYEWFLDLPADPQGKRGGEGARILSFLAPEMLAFTWTFPPTVQELRARGETTQVVVRLEAISDSSTRVRLDQTGWRSGPAWDAGYAYFDEAWGYVLQALEEHYRTDPGGRRNRDRPDARP